LVREPNSWRGAGLSFSGVAQGVRRQAGAGILTSPQFSAAVLEFSLVNERVASMQLQVAGGKTLTAVCVLMHRTAVKSIRPSWSLWVASWKGFHLGTPVLLGDFNVHVGKDGKT